jgi:succinate-acetate transporter protein
MTQSTSGPVPGTDTRTVPAPRVSADTGIAAPPAPPVAAPEGEPATLGLPSFLVGAIALGLVLVRFVPAAPAGAAVPIVLTAAAAGMAVAALWAMRLGQSAAAGINGVFAGFWLSYAALVLGLTHNWFGVLPIQIQRTQETFLIAWIVVVGLMLLGSLRLPLVYTAMLALIEASFVLNLIGTVQASTMLTRTAGWVIFAFSAVGAYLYLSVLSQTSGGRPYPLGRPVLG